MFRTAHFYAKKMKIYHLPFVVKLLPKNGELTNYTFFVIQNKNLKPYLN